MMSSHNTLEIDDEAEHDHSTEGQHPEETRDFLAMVKLLLSQKLSVFDQERRSSCGANHRKRVPWYKTLYGLFTPISLGLAFISMITQTFSVSTWQFALIFDLSDFLGSVVNSIKFMLVALIESYWRRNEVTDDLGLFRRFTDLKYLSVFVFGCVTCICNIIVNYCYNSYFSVAFGTGEVVALTLIVFMAVENHEGPSIVRLPTFLQSQFSDIRLLSFPCLWNIPYAMLWLFLATALLIAYDVNTSQSVAEHATRALFVGLNESIKESSFTPWFFLSFVFAILVLLCVTASGCILKMKNAINDPEVFENIVRIGLVFDKLALDLQHSQQVAEDHRLTAYVTQKILIPGSEGRTSEDEVRRWVQIVRAAEELDKRIEYAERGVEIFDTLSASLSSVTRSLKPVRERLREIIAWKESALKTLEYQLYLRSRFSKHFFLLLVAMIPVVARFISSIAYVNAAEEIAWSVKINNEDYFAVKWHYAYWGSTISLFSFATSILEVW